MQRQERFLPSPTTYIAHVDQETVLLDLRQGIFLGLNRSATTLWHLVVEEQGDLEQVARQLAESIMSPLSAFKPI